MGLTFKQFIELTEKIPGHLASLKDLFGINPRDFAGSTEPDDPKNNKRLQPRGGGSPQWASFMSFGNNTYNGSPYEIVGFKYGKDGEPTFAQVRLINLKGTTRQKYQKKDGKLVNVPDGADDKIYLMPIKGKGQKDTGIEDLLTQPWSQSPPPSGGDLPM
jgi:hypothetical protein